MKTSARNAIRGSIVNIASDTLNAEIEVSVSPQTTIYSLITHASMEELGLCPGRSVTLLIKAPFVAIAIGKTAPKTSARNCISGIISRCETTTVSAEVVLDIGAGKTLASSITAQSAKSLRLAPGKSAFAVFDAAPVIIAIN